MKNSSIKKSLIRELLMGFCLGTANIIPGVSGGTFLLVFNIYERVFAALNQINKASVLQFISLLIRLLSRPGKISVKMLVDFLQTKDFIFLLKLMVGAIIAIIFLSNLMKYLITYQFSLTYALFFGLILVSILVPYALLKKKTIKVGLFVFSGAFLTICLTMAVNPYDKIKMKSDMHEKSYKAASGAFKESLDTAGAQSSALFTYSGRYTPKEYGYAALCGAIAISAMVLPGVSGSLVLILMGEYFEVISAISALGNLNLDAMVFLSFFTMGILLGGLLFARLLTLVLKKYYDATMAFLAGLMAGSLYALWPFKKSIVMAHQYIKKEGSIQVLENVRIYTNVNQIPAMDAQIGLVFAAFIIGCVIMYFFVRKENL